jgi:hypothetical protein
MPGCGTAVAEIAVRSTRDTAAGKSMPSHPLTAVLIRAMVIVTAVAVAVSVTDDLGAYGALVSGAIVVLLGETILSARRR